MASSMEAESTTEEAVAATAAGVALQSITRKENVAVQKKSPCTTQQQQLRFKPAPKKALLVLPNETVTTTVFPKINVDSILNNSNNTPVELEEILQNRSYIKAGVAAAREWLQEQQSKKPELLLSKQSPSVTAASNTQQQQQRKRAASFPAVYDAGNPKSKSATGVGCGSTAAVVEQRPPVVDPSELFTIFRKMEMVTSYLCRQICFKEPNLPRILQDVEALDAVLKEQQTKLIQRVLQDQDAKMRHNKKHSKWKKPSTFNSIVAGVTDSASLSLSKASAATVLQEQNEPEEDKAKTTDDDGKPLAALKLLDEAAEDARRKDQRGPLKELEEEIMDLRAKRAGKRYMELQEQLKKGGFDEHSKRLPRGLIDEICEQYGVTKNRLEREKRFRLNREKAALGKAASGNDPQDGTVEGGFVGAQPRDQSREEQHRKNKLRMMQRYQQKDEEKAAASARAKLAAEQYVQIRLAADGKKLDNRQLMELCEEFKVGRGQLFAATRKIMPPLEQAQVEHRQAEKRRIQQACDEYFALSNENPATLPHGSIAHLCETYNITRDQLKHAKRRRLAQQVKAQGKPTSTGTRGKQQGEQGCGGGGGNDVAEIKYDIGPDDDNDEESHVDGENDDDDDDDDVGYEQPLMTPVTRTDNKASSSPSKRKASLAQRTREIQPPLDAEAAHEATATIMQHEDNDDGEDNDHDDMSPLARAATALAQHAALQQQLLHQQQAALPLAALQYASAPNSPDAIAQAQQHRHHHPAAVDSTANNKKSKLSSKTLPLQQAPAAAATTLRHQPHCQPHHYW